MIMDVSQIPKDCSSFPISYTRFAALSKSPWVFESASLKAFQPKIRDFRCSRAVTRGFSVVGLVDASLMVSRRFVLSWR